MATGSMAYATYGFREDDRKRIAKRRREVYKRMGIIKEEKKESK